MSLADKYCGKECFCNEQSNTKSCSIHGIYKTSDVLEHDPESLVCPNGSINVPGEY